MNCKRQYLLCGHYGSGKTNIAVNLATLIKEEHPEKDVAVMDLDIVNPYYRTSDSKAFFEEKGIRLISSPYAGSNLDAPALPDEIYSAIDIPDQISIIDVGGDDRGALALGRLSGAIRKAADYEMFMVINCYRPLTKTPEETVEVFQEIETAAGLPFTAIINNSNLGIETEEETVLKSLEYAKKVSELTGLPLVATAVEEKLFSKLNGKIEHLFPMKLQERPV